jgi:hypothetical protein
MDSIDASVGRLNPWPRRLCAVLFWSGCLVAAALIIQYGMLGMLLGYAIWALAWAAATRADPSKWP